MSEPKVTRALLERYAHIFNTGEVLRAFGATVSFPDLETVQLAVASIRDDQRGGLGTDAINGGVIAGLFDFAIGFTPALLNPANRSATVQLSMQFMRPLRGNSIKLVASIERAGGSLVFAKAVALDPTDQACATCTGMARLSDLPWDPKMLARV